MGFIGSLFSGSQGAGFQAQQAATPEQAQQLYQQQQQRLQQQQAFTQALMAQSPQAIAAQQQILGQLQQQAQGAGPSVAQGQLAEATRQNVGRTAAMMAGQRGAGANVGLMARQAAMAGSGAQQQAAGQAATLRAQEQLAAQQTAAALAGQQIGQIGGAQQIGIQAVGGAQQNILDQIARQNQINAQIAAGNQAFQSKLTGGVLGSLAQAPFMAAEGGEVPSEDDSHRYWKDVAKNFAESMRSEDSTGAFKAGQQIGNALGKGIQKLIGTPEAEGQTAGGYSGANLGVNPQMPSPVNPLATSQSIGAYRLPFKEGGKVPAMVSPGEKYLSPTEVKKVKNGEKEPIKAGQMIPGKAKVPGNSYANDTIPKTLEEGGIVIPRSVMQSKNPSENARKFVDAILAKQSLKGKRK